MDLKAHLSELTVLLDKPDPKSASDLHELTLKLLPLVALAQHDSIDVSADDFNSLNNESRKLALASLASVLIQTYDL